ncbi:hypothetical protein CEXT_556431 [Caerostris extrusa]|uniref:Uncharacterized protein n=1 Tax=Caerostris extrusa TaxID=172846 RepID=A0AAV4WYX5_CAEEX|nr:hypothetical protein CEXT_556431 [Caerostris extrusa]
MSSTTFNLEMYTPHHSQAGLFSMLENVKNDLSGHQCMKYILLNLEWTRSADSNKGHFVKCHLTRCSPSEQVLMCSLFSCCSLSSRMLAQPTEKFFSAGMSTEFSLDHPSSTAGRRQAEN